MSDNSGLLKIEEETRFMNETEVVNYLGLTIKKLSENVKKGEYRVSILNYNQVLEKANNYTINIFDIIKELCHNHLGTIYLQIKLYDKAIYHLEEAIRFAARDDDSRHLRFCEGQVYFYMGDYEKARRCFENLANKKRDSHIINWISRSSFNLNFEKNWLESLKLIENYIFSVDIENIDGLIFAAEICTKKGFPEIGINHLIAALGLITYNKKIYNLEIAEHAKNLFATIMNNQKFHKFLFQTSSDLTFFRALLGIIKDYGSFETGLILFENCLDIKQINSNHKEYLNFLKNVVQSYELIDKRTKVLGLFEKYFQIFPENGLPGLKNKDLLNLIKNDEEESNNSNNFNLKELNFLKHSLTESNRNQIELNEVDLELLGCLFSLVKNLFISGNLKYYYIFSKQIIPFVKRNFKGTPINSQYNTFDLLLKVSQFIELPLNIDSENPIYLIGDLNSLPLSWQVINNRRVIPKIMNEFKIWELKSDSQTKSKINLDSIISSIPQNSTVIMFLGKGDCQVSIPQLYNNCQYRSIQDACSMIVNVYLEKISKYEEKNGFKIYLHPIHLSSSDHIEIIKNFNSHLNNQKKLVYLDFFNELYSGKAINPRFSIDSEHLHPGYKILIEQILK